VSKRLGLNAQVISPHSLSSPPPSVEENPKRHRVFARPLLRRLDVQPVVCERPLQRVVRVEQLDSEDLLRMAELVIQYADLPLGSVDASVIAVAERLGVTTVMTIDRRHFTVVRPRHVDAFNLLP